jgi:hypothetical protein
VQKKISKKVCNFPDLAFPVSDLRNMGKKPGPAKNGGRALASSVERFFLPGTFFGTFFLLLKRKYTPVGHATQEIYVTQEIYSCYSKIARPAQPFGRASFLAKTREKKQ